MHDSAQHRFHPKRERGHPTEKDAFQNHYNSLSDDVPAFLTWSCGSHPSAVRWKEQGIKINRNREFNDTETEGQIRGKDLLQKRHKKRKKIITEQEASEVPPNYSLTVIIFLFIHIHVRRKLGRKSFVCMYKCMYAESQGDVHLLLISSPGLSFTDLFYSQCHEVAERTFNSLTLIFQLLKGQKDMMPFQNLDACGSWLMSTHIKNTLHDLTTAVHKNKI